MNVVWNRLFSLKNIFHLGNKIKDENLNFYLFDVANIVFMSLVCVMVQIWFMNIILFTIRKPNDRCSLMQFNNIGFFEEIVVLWNRILWKYVTSVTKSILSINFHIARIILQTNIEEKFSNCIKIKVMRKIMCWYRVWHLV